MNAITEAKVRSYLYDHMKYDANEVGAIVWNMRALARLGGHELDDGFAHAGLGAGPEARIAAGIVDLALLGGGCETSTYAIRQEIGNWLRTTQPTGMIA